jgi:hypothetical protein
LSSSFFCGLFYGVLVIYTRGAQIFQKT